MTIHGTATEKFEATGRAGAVAAGGAPSRNAGIAMLAAGGNAADAAAATILALTVCDYGLTCIGGECALLVYDARTGSVKSLSGQGRAPLSSEAISWFYANGLPMEGHLKASPVPGILDLCVTLLRLYGTVSFERAVEATLVQLQANTEPWHGALLNTILKIVEAEKGSSGSREDKLIAARDRFYKGDIALELEEYYLSSGGFLRREDFAAHETIIEEPVCVDYRGYAVYKCGPWTQGPSVCQSLRLLEGFDIRSMGHNSAQHIHTGLEALKLAFADRDEYYADPTHESVPMEALLSDRYTELRRALIKPNRALESAPPGDPLVPAAVKAGMPPESWIGGTTTCLVADKWGNVVAATPSANRPYHLCESLGIAHANRLTSLNTTPGHVNRIKPGKRPRITLTPTIVLREGKPVLAISVYGGDLQDQATVNLLLNTIDFGMSPVDAVRAPRFSTKHHEDSFNPSADRASALVKRLGVRLNDGIADNVVAELEVMGHQIESFSRPIGISVIMGIDTRSGKMSAAGDAGRHVGTVE